MLAIKSAINNVYTSHERKENKIIIEPDCLEAISSITRIYKHPPAEMQRLLEEINYMAARYRFYFRHIRSEGNEPANWLARQDETHKMLQAWTGNWPQELAILLLKHVHDDWC